MAFQKVQRKAAKMRVAVAGPSGAGKTLSALYLAGGAEPHRCTDCNTVIMAAQGRSAEQIAEGTVKNYGRKHFSPLCRKPVQLPGSGCRPEFLEVM